MDARRWRQVAAVGLFGAVLALACASPSSPAVVDGGAGTVTAGRPKFGEYSSGGPGSSGGSSSGSVPTGTGFFPITAGAAGATALGPNPIAPDSGASFLVLQYGTICGDAGPYCLAALTSNEIGAPFSVSLALASGGGTFEVKQTGCAPTYTASPAANSGSITPPSAWVDNQGNSTTTSSGNPLTAPNGGGSYVVTAPGTVTASLTETQTSPHQVATGSATGCTFFYRWFHGPASDTAPGTGSYAITASTNNATLSNTGGGTVSGTLSGTLSSFGVGTTFSDTLSGQYEVFAVPHSGTTHTINGCAPAPCTPIVSTPVTEIATSYAFTNQFGETSIAMDLYESQAALNQTFDFTVTQ